MAERSAPVQPAYPHTTYNFIVVTLDAICFFAGLAFIDPLIVLPVLVDRMGGSQVVVGLMPTIQHAGWLIPQLLATSFVLHRSRKKPFVMWPVVVSRLPFVLLAVAFSLPGAGDHLRALLLLLIGVYIIFFFGDGLVGVPWHDIVARTIPPTLRGRFFGSINFFGGFFIVGCGWVVRRVLADPSLPFPQNYGRLFILVCVCMALSTFFLALMREPTGAAFEERQSLRRIVGSIPSLLRRNRLLRRVIIAQNLSGIAGLAVPFYALYAHEKLGVPYHYGGTFIQTGILGLMAASILWAYLNDRRGPLAVIRGVTALRLTVPIAALAIPPLVLALGARDRMALGYSLVFLLNSAAGSGTWMGTTNYVFELARDETRPLFLGLAATLSSPAVFMPLIGGLLLDVIDYRTLFAIVIVGTIAACVYVMTLERPHVQEVEPAAGVAPYLSAGPRPAPD